MNVSLKPAWLRSAVESSKITRLKLAASKQHDKETFMAATSPFVNVGVTFDVYSVQQMQAFMTEK